MTVSKAAQRLIQKSQAGQALVIMAMGFVALLGFVGIVTDVSLMFVNYNTLTRAIDAASVAAAGQVRRLVPNADELAFCDGSSAAAMPDAEGNCTLARNQAFARSFANVGVAARQFLEFYGVNPKAVVIDMCSTVSQPDPDAPTTLIPIEGLEEDFDELCANNNNQRKLIRVTAQSSSPTVFMRLLGWPDITLQATAISETAVLDVVLILDVSESMLNQTTYETWALDGYDKIYLPPQVNAAMAAEEGFTDAFSFPWSIWQKLSLEGQDIVNARMEARNNPFDPGYNPGSAYRYMELEYPRAVNPPYTGPGRDPIREECRVRFWPYSTTFTIPSELRSLYADAGTPWTGSDRWEGFVPNYNYYDCCNDPNGDGSFDDLLCQPFKQARDATQQFLGRIDFLRGDRVAFVTFDREAFLVRYENAAGDITHMIESESDAVQILRQYIGVRSEPGFYKPSVAVMDGVEVGYMPWQPDSDGGLARSDALDSEHDYYVASSCPFHDAGLGFPYGGLSSPDAEFAGYPGSPFTYNPANYPDLLSGIRRPSGAAWNIPPAYSAAFYSYDMWASCRGTNIGAALREGSNALLDQRTTRTDGSVWVMVLLSDGAAAGSDPVFDGGQPTAPENLNYPYIEPRIPVTYGGLGVCPYGTSLATSELVDYTDPKDSVGFAPSFPFCSDEIPETRHFCFDPSPDPVTGEQNYVDLSRGGCNWQEYDVDDYARDWADWIGLAEPPNAGSSAEQRSISQLPTIFTIGFGLNFQYGTTRCTAGDIRVNASSPNLNDIGDCLGEELLRYIADVGDNFQIDSDYQQDYLDDGFLNLSISDDDWGDRGPCEDFNINPSSVGSANDLIAPLPAGENCGNYYNAPGGQQLEDVFDDIASRMFTRLTQ